MVYQNKTGLFGKLPAHGDFIYRDLPARFINVWDQWLQGYIGTSREKLGDQWLDVYMTSPIWRFALSEGAVDENAWAGMRSKKEAHNLSDYKFIEIKIRTDGQPYHFQMEHDDAWEKDKLGITIDIVKNKWKTMHMEMADFNFIAFRNML